MLKFVLAVIVSALVAWLIVAPSQQHTVKGPHTFCDGKVYCRTA